MDSATPCPLCGGPNGCGIAQGKPDCWCFSTSIPPDVLARVPEDQRDVACVCRTCADATDLPDAVVSKTPQQS